MFERAVKRNAKLRFAICGPAGGGKTYSLLELAKNLAGGGKVAVIDTEHGSASKYADLFEFDVVEPSTFDPRELVKTIDAAVEGGYAVIVVDSLSHYWMGKGGELDMVDAAAKRSSSGNTFAAWKNVTPYHQALVDKILSAKIHVLVSMRTKTEWVIEEVNGKRSPRKIGLAPVMRDGIEFEFDVCGEIDQDNTLTITKSRCPKLSGASINRPGAEMADTLREWLQGAPDDRPEPPAWAPNEPMIAAFTEAAKDLTADDVMSVLNDFGVARPQELTDKAQATACYKALVARAGKGK
jgi:hypothetical protein